MGVNRYQQLKEFVRSQPDVFRFLVMGFGGYIVWHLSYENFFRPATFLDEYVTENLILLSEKVLAWMGYELNTHFQIMDQAFRNRIGIKGSGGVFVGPSCDGVVLFALFSIFILSFPGNWKRKAWFIPSGVIVVHFANVLRVICLLLIQVYWPSALDFNHDYTFTVFVYSIIFALWYLYAAQNHGPHLRPSAK
jgi:exosortase family protein XrtF